MKRIMCFYGLIFLLFALFPQGNDYIAIRDTPIYKMKSNWNGIYYDAEEILKEGDHVRLYGNVVSDISKLHEDVVSNIFIQIYSAEGEALRVNANDIKSVKSQQIIESKYLSVPEDESDALWVRKYLLKMIGNQNIRLALDYQPQLKGYGEANVYDDGWYAEVLREPMMITNAEIGLGLSGDIANTIIENTDDGFVIYSDGTLLNEKEFSDYEFETDELKRFEFKFDGDYCNIYLNDSATPLLSFVKLQISEYHKLKRLIEVPTEVFLAKYQDYNKYENQLEEYLRQNTINPDEFIWPRHADGTCDYEDEGGNATAGENANKEELADALITATENNDAAEVRRLIAAGADVNAKANDGKTALMLAAEYDSADVAALLRAADREPANVPATERAESEEESATPKPAPAVGKTAAVTENLRLRTDDDRTAEVVATLAAGTRVKVEAPGRGDTIDGIASNWVRVEVLGSARDRDGNPVAAGTQGWLFGGYLSSAEEAESQSPGGEEDAAKAPALPIVLIAAGDAVFVILLAVRKRKGGKGQM